MTKDEVLKLALEALENSIDAVRQAMELRKRLNDMWTGVHP